MGQNKETDPALEPALRDVDSIQNLDTARLALRWALERMRALERRATDMEQAVQQSDAAQHKSAAELDAARDLLTRRLAEAAERESYYAKIEEYLTLKLDGGLDPSALAKREVRLDAREAEARKREIETEAKLKEARLRAEEELRRVQAEAAAAADLSVRRIRAEFEDRSAVRDREMGDRFVAIHEKEAALAAMEKSLSERRKRFEEFHAAQRAAMEREATAINEMVSDQAEFLERRVEQALAQRSAALERSWTTEKALLMEELAAFRAKAREHLPELMDARRQSDEVAEKNTRLTDENALLQQNKAELLAELARWRSEAQNDLPALLAAVRRATEAEEQARHLEVELEAASRLAEEYKAQLMSDETSHRQRMSELTLLESTLSAKLKDAEQDLFRQYDTWRDREDMLRRRDQDWRMEAEARNMTVDAVRAEVVVLREELKKSIAAYRAKVDPTNRAGDQKSGGKEE